jgi:hypothetical protein
LSYLSGAGVVSSAWTAGWKADMAGLLEGSLKDGQRMANREACVMVDVRPDLIERCVSPVHHDCMVAVIASSSRFTIVDTDDADGLDGIDGTAEIGGWH